MGHQVVIMGVAGSGKSTLGQILAASAGWPLVEGDDFHSDEHRQQMAAGRPLTDADRAIWLDALAGRLQAHPAGVVLTCSALRRVHRSRLRAAAPGLCFLFLAIDAETARWRVASRGADHFFPPQLIDSQFAALEPPEGEVGVLRLDARQPPEALSRQALHWLREGRGLLAPGGPAP